MAGREGGRKDKGDSGGGKERSLDPSEPEKSFPFKIYFFGVFIERIKETYNY